MEIKKLKFKGVFEITLSPINDSRGFFMRTYDTEIFTKNNLHKDWIQENHSRSEQKGIIRGLHFQIPPFAEAKLVRCIRGAVLDVYLDLRDGSETFGKCGNILLNEDNKKMILIPRGFAHGFCTLTDISEIIYKVDNYYSRQHEHGIVWNDKNLSIKWPVESPILSEKDRVNMSMVEFTEQYGGLVV